MKADILYRFHNGLYVNMTNKCPCACTFCIRQNGDTVGESDSLWLKKDPTVAEVIADFEATDLSQYSEIVFCGYGEPLVRLDAVLEVCRYLRGKTTLPLRLNTNGLADLIHKKRTAPLLEGLFDTVSVSLNAPTAEKYCAVTRPSFGEAAFDAMLAFTRDVKNFVPHVVMSVVDVIPQEDIDACRKVAEEIGVELRVREYTAD